MSNPEEKKNPPESSQPAVENHTADKNEQKESPKNSNRSRRLWGFTILLIVIGLAWLAYWFFYSRFHQYTDDAYANGNLININSAVPGSVIAFYADNTDLVAQGQLLVELDPTDYQAIFEKELASLAAVVLQVRQLFNTVAIYQASVASNRATVDKLQYDYENRKELVTSLAVSNEEFIHAQDDLLVAEMNLKQAEAQLKVSLDAIGNTTLEKHPLIEQQKGNVRNAYYNLRHCSIYAPSTGYVAQRSVDVGEWVIPQTNLMAVIPQDYWWVDANYKETQLKNMRIGQPTVVTFDLYGRSIKYHGKVLGIASGTGSVFSLIPPQNATGNWIKIVQRLPVRISLDPKVINDYPPRLGISASAHVDITNQDLPRLALCPPFKAVSTTNVFDINMDELEQMMDEVILENLKNEEKNESTP